MGGAGSRHSSGPAPHQTADAQLGSRHAAGFRLVQSAAVAAPERRTAAVLVAQAIVRAATAAHPVQSPVWRDALPARKPQGLSWPVAPAMAGQPDLAPAEHDAQLRLACAAARRPRRPGAQAAPGDTEPAQRSRGQLADRGWRTSGRRALARPAGPAVFLPTGTAGSALELGGPARAERRVALARASVEPALRAGADRLGTDLRRLRLQPLSQPTHPP